MQYHNSESDSSDTSSDKNNSDSSKRKPVSLACLICKSKHMRCDGEYPCNNCSKKGIKCAYQQQPTRRGPIPGKVKELRKSVEQLTQELSTQRQKFQDLQEKYQFLVKKQTEAADITLSGHLLTTHALDHIMKRYEEHIYPFIQVATPFKDFSFMQDKNVDNSQLLCMYACLLAGSMASGNDIHTDELFHRVKNGLNALYDKTDPYVCGTYHILSRSYATFVEPDKASLCNATALHMSDRLMKKFKVKELCGVNLVVIRQVCLLNQALEVDKEGQVAAIHQLIQESPVGSESLPLQTTLLLNKIWNDLMVAMALCDKDFNSIDNIKFMFGLIKQAEAMANKSDPMLTSLLMMRINAVSSVLSFLIGLDHASDLLACKMIEAAEQITRPESSHIYFVVIPLFMVGQILMYRGDHVKIQRLVAVLRCMAEMADNVSAIIEAFTRLDCFEFNKVSMYNQALFYNLIHRFRQTNLMYGNSWDQFSESDVLPAFTQEQRAPKIIELGSANPRRVSSGQQVSSTAPVTKKARIDNSQYCVTSTVTTGIHNQSPSKMSDPIGSQARQNVSPISYNQQPNTVQQRPANYQQPAITTYNTNIINNFQSNSGNTVYNVFNNTTVNNQQQEFSQRENNQQNNDVIYTKSHVNMNDNPTRSAVEQQFFSQADSRGHYPTNIMQPNNSAYTTNGQQHVIDGLKYDQPSPLAVSPLFQESPQRSQNYQLANDYANYMQQQGYENGSPNGVNMHRQQYPHPQVDYTNQGYYYVQQYQGVNNAVNQPNNNVNNNASEYDYR